MGENNEDAETAAEPAISISLYDKDTKRTPGQRIVSSAIKYEKVTDFGFRKRIQRDAQRVRGRAKYNQTRRELQISTTQMHTPGTSGKCVCPSTNSEISTCKLIAVPYRSIKHHSKLLTFSERCPRSDCKLIRLKFIT